MAKSSRLLPNAVADQSEEDRPAHVVWCGSESGLFVRDLPGERVARDARATVRGVLRAAGIDESSIEDAELAVGELAANAVSHAAGPYEIRFVLVAGRPIWCEIIDGDEDLAGIPEKFAKLRSADAVDSISDEAPQENGHGLAIVHRLSGGRCKAYPTVTCTTGQPGKAVAFALPGVGPR